jgi:hypothetical protein
MEQTGAKLEPAASKLRVKGMHAVGQKSIIMGQPLEIIGAVPAGARLRAEP